MLCPRCQHENPAGQKFCGECGARLAAVCGSCGAANPPAQKFCGDCGGALAGGPGTPKAPAPESYTPRHLAEKILTSKAALEGERKQVTVLFADLKGSMELLADRDPEEARRLLDPVLEHMMEAVHRYEGTVNQVMGDGIMALFGAPVAHEDHAVRACYTALRMQESVKQYAEEVRRSHAAVVKIRVGLNSGEVVVRAIGSDLHMDYTAVGQTTHLAARMEQIADPGAIVITPDTLALAEGYVEVKSLGPIPVKGLSAPIEIFELTGAGQARTRLQASALRGLTRFVGRDAEVEHLRRVLGQAGGGHGQVAAIVGEAGVGKSRLTYEFTHSHRVQDWLILEASSVSYGQATSYLPVIDLLKGYFKIGDRDTHREMRDKVMGRVLGLDRALEPLLAPLLALLDVPVEDATWQGLDAPQRRQRTLDAAKRLLLRESQVQPLLLVFEDLHWIDGETQALLDSLVESLGSAHLLLLVNYRPEYHHDWSGKTAYSQMRLDALAAESAGALLDALLGDDPSLAPLKQLLVKRGNPFFLEETIRMLVETTALEGARGQYRLTQPLLVLQIPATVQTILAARIDRLSPEDKRLLQTAAVVGKDVPFALLQAIAELPDEALRAGLDRLRVAEFLYETGLYPDLEYAFKHALTHEVTYDSLLQERRRNLHAQLVGAIERLHADRLDEHIERLAHHAFRGELWEKAVDYNRSAGARAYTREAFTEAVIGFERAIQAADHLPEGPGARELALDLRAHLRPGLTNTGQLDRCLDLSRDVFERASALGDPKRLAVAATGLANSLYLAGRYSEALEASRRACALAEPLGDPRLLAVARWNFAQVCEAIGDHAAVVDVMEANLELCRQYPDLNFGFIRGPVAEVMSRIWLAWCLAQRGDFRGAIAVMQPAIDLDDPKESPYLRTGRFVGAGYVHLLQGEIATAISYFERGLHLCTSFALPIWLPVCAGSLGYAYTLDGRLAEGRDLLRRAVDASTRVNRVHHAHWLAWLGEANLLSTDLEHAAEAARTALAMARERGERGNEVWALRLQAEIAAAGDPSSVTTAETHYREAHVLAEQLGMRPPVAHCHLGLGKLYRRTGQPNEAREHLTTATTLYREMDMRFYLEQAEAELRELGGA